MPCLKEFRNGMVFQCVRYRFGLRFGMFVHISGDGKRHVNNVHAIDSRQSAAYTLQPDFLEGDIPYGKEFNLAIIGLYVRSMCFIEKKKS